MSFKKKFKHVFLLFKNIGYNVLLVFFHFLNSFD
jgi:hypothetical protein